MVTTVRFSYRDESGKVICRRDFVTLGKGDSHEWYGFISRGLGCVICTEDFQTAEKIWNEFDANDPVFMETLIRNLTSARMELTTAFQEGSAEDEKGKLLYVREEVVSP